MRVSTTQIYNNLLSGIRNQLDIQNKGNAQISSGTRFQTPAQAGIDYKLSLDIRSSQSNVKGSLDALATAEARLNVSQALLTDVNNLMTRAQTIAVQQNTPALTAGQRQAAANEVGALLDRFLINANTQWQGQSLFAGTAVNQNAFVQDPATGTITYNGNAQDRVVAVTSDQQLTTNIRGDDPAFLNAMQSLQSLQTALQNNDLAGISAAELSLTSASDAMVNVTARAGGMVSNVLSYKNSFQDMQTQLELRLNSHESVDVAAVITQVQQSSTALQAAYSQIAKLGNLSLTKYL